MTNAGEILSGLRECLPNGGGQIGPHEDLLIAGVLDSLTFLDFVAAVEKRFGVTLPDETVFGDKFNTLSQVADAVGRLLHQ